MNAAGVSGPVTENQRVEPVADDQDAGLATLDGSGGRARRLGISGADGGRVRRQCSLRSWRRRRSPRDRLGLAVQLCTVPWLGYVPNDVIGALLAVVVRQADQLRITSEEVLEKL